nr:MAG TPA: hypothetical protein [Caudoviricetes sp.]
MIVQVVQSIVILDLLLSTLDMFLTSKARSVKRIIYLKPLHVIKAQGYKFTCPFDLIIILLFCQI